MRGDGVRDRSSRGRDSLDRVLLRTLRLPSWFGKSKAKSDDVGLLDAATGLPTHKALEIAAGELENRSLVERRSIAVARLYLQGIDVDVAEELAEAVRRTFVPLRAYDRLYSMGGADLVLLLPGGDTRDAIEVVTGMQAEVKSSRARASRGELIAGISSSLNGEPFGFASILGEAERALDDASRSGGLVVRPNLHTEVFGNED